MATNTKSRATPARQPAMLRTPEPKSHRRGAPGSVLRGGFSIQQKEGILQAMDLEIAERTQRFQDALDFTLRAFLSRQKYDMMRLPEQLRKMTLRDIQKTWDGNMMKTVERMQREVMERDAAEKREREEAERREKEGAKRKRDEAEENDDKAARGKTARKGKTPALTPLGKLAAPRTGKKGGKPLFSNPNNKPSGLPQDHIFAPHFPADTPVRQLKKTDILYTANGSPIMNPFSASLSSLSVSPIATKGSGSGAGPRSPLRQAHNRLPSGATSEGEEEEGDETVRPEMEEEGSETEGEGDGDLPDVDALEKQLEAQALGTSLLSGTGTGLYPSLSHIATSSSSASSSSNPNRLKRLSSANGAITTSTLPIGSGKLRRPSSLLIRRSMLAPTASAQSLRSAEPESDSNPETSTQTQQAEPEQELAPHLRKIVIRDHEIVFDPLNLDRNHLQDELDAGGIYTDEEKDRARREVQRLVLKAMQEYQESWATGA